MTGLPTRIFGAAEVRELDRIAIEERGIPGYTLMSRAGEAVFEALQARWSEARAILVLCGAGNNAGDGYVIARLAHTHGFAVTVVALISPDHLKGDALKAYRDYEGMGGQLTDWDPALLPGHDVVVDAILGTGLDRPLEGALRSVVEAVAAAERPVLAVDIPTGLHADSGEVLGAAIRADLTVTFIGLKAGLFVGRGRDHVGQIEFAGLDVPADVGDNVDCRLKRIDEGLAVKVLPRRARTAHKGDHGHVLLVGGGPGMPGAIRLAAEAALRSGAGLVTVATLPAHVPIIVTARPEIMATGVEKPEQLAGLLERADVVAFGPGLGQGEWGRGMLARVLSCEQPLVVDADALNLIAEEPKPRGRWILTPHPGEAARLLGADTRTVQRDRPAAASRLARDYDAISVLKGAGTLVARAEDVPWICDRGNPGMAGPGMGDVLTGLIAGILAQTGELFDAARVGVLIHAAAADEAAGPGERGLIATDLFDRLKSWLNPS